MNALKEDALREIAFKEMLRYIKRQLECGKTTIRLNKFSHILRERRVRGKVKNQISVSFEWGYYASARGKGDSDGWYLRIL